MRARRRAKKKPSDSAAARYFRASRTLAASYVFIAPFFAIYQAALAFDAGVRSGSAPILNELFSKLSHLGLLALNAGLLGLLLLAIWNTRSKRHQVNGLYGLMFLESLGWAAFMMSIAIIVTPRMLAIPQLALPESARQLFAHAGAGIYEEILFRYLLMGGLILVLHRGLNAPTVFVVPFACVFSAVLFSYAHHALGGEPFTWGVFGYRIVMGLILGTAYWLRGLGIVVYAHALYNVALVMMNHANGS